MIRRPRINTQTIFPVNVKVILLGLGFAFSLVINAVLFDAAKTFYTREAKFRLHPTGTPTFLETGASELPSVLLLGDSRMAHWKEFAPASYHAVNAGVGNETTAQIWLRAGRDIDHVEPAVVVIEAGINDLKVIPLMPSKQKEIENDCINNIMSMVEAGRKHGALVVVLSVLPAGEVGLAQRLVWSDAVGESVKMVNLGLAARCHNDAGVRFVDLGTEVQAGRDYVDTLHFNAAFYRRITPLVVGAIEAMHKK